MTLARPSFPKYKSRTFSAIPLVTYANHNKKNKRLKDLADYVYQKTPQIAKKENLRKSPLSKACTKPEQIKKSIKSQNLLHTVITQQK